MLGWLSLGVQAQRLEVSGRVSAQTEAQTQRVYLMNLTDGQALDSCALSDGTFCLSAELPERQPLCISPLNIYLVGEPGTVTVEADKSLRGTLLNELWNAYLQDRAKYVQDYNRQYQSAKNDMLLSKEQRRGLLQSLRDEYEATFKSRALNMMRRNLNNPLNTLAFLEFSTQMEEVTTFDLIYALTTEETRRCPRVQQVAQRMEQVRSTWVGEMFTDFTVPAGKPDGTEARLSDYVGRGKYLLVDFWASWCGPCRTQLPYLRRVYEQYQGAEFDVLGVATWDKRGNSQKALDEDHLPWEQILEAGDLPSETYGFKGLPQIMLFGPDGKILARGLRGEALVKAAEELKIKK